MKENFGKYKIGFAYYRNILDCDHVDYMIKNIKESDGSIVVITVLDSSSYHSDERYRLPRFALPMIPETIKMIKIESTQLNDSCQMVIETLTNLCDGYGR